MKEYHFENDGKDLEQTIRLDDINEKVKQIKGSTVDDELGDANDFLKAFESEKFDTMEGGILPEKAREEDVLEDTRRTVPEVWNTEDDAEEWEEIDQEEGFGLSKRAIGLLAVLGVAACVLGFSLVRCGFHPASASNPVEDTASPMLVESVLNAEELIIYDIAEGSRRTITLTEETKVTDEAGRSIAYGNIKIGDLVMVELDKDSKTALSVDYGGAIQTREVTGLEINTKERTMTSEEDSFVYGEKVMVLYNEETISPADLEPSDKLLLKGVEETVWSIEVLEYHGYIVVENSENIKNGEIQLDEEDPIPLQGMERMAVREGTHTVTVTGDTIETRKDSIFVEAGEEFSYDLSKAQEKVGVIIIHANVSDYKLYINGTLVDSTTPAVLPMGEYDLVILKNGYLEWSHHVNLDQNTVTVNAELQKDIQYGTLTITAGCDGAQVYINGEAYGIAPMQVNLPYGSYSVRVEKDGYDTFEQTVYINDTSVSLYAEME